MLTTTEIEDGKPVGYHELVDFLRDCGLESWLPGPFVGYMLHQGALGVSFNRGIAHNAPPTYYVLKSTKAQIIELLRSWDSVKRLGGKDTDIWIPILGPGTSTDGNR